MRATRPSFSIAFRSFWLTTLISAGVRRFAVPYAREAEEIARKLRAARMEDEGSAHSEDSTEKAGFEDDIVSRRSLTGSRGEAMRAGWWSSSRPERTRTRRSRLHAQARGGAPVWWSRD